MNETPEKTSLSPCSSTYNSIIFLLGVVTILIILATTILTFMDKNTPDLLIGLGAASSSSLAALLSPFQSSRKKDNND